MKLFYIIFGSTICVLFLYAGATGWSVMSGSAATWGARGAAGFHHK
ncbi:MAG: hypothetical protein KF767_09840 [Bdellovibrionaceae bacterium]|nr:hypothetical protein [Pseudobdellovibrionaceae bacterium]